MKKKFPHHPFIQHLYSLSPQNDISTDQATYRQAVIDLIVHAGMIGRESGFKNPTDYPFNKAMPELMLEGIERLLNDVLILIHFAENMESENEDTSRASRTH